MSIKNNGQTAVLTNLLVNPKFKYFRYLCLIVVLVLFAYLNVFSGFKGRGLFYAFILSLPAFAFPIYINIYLLIPRYLVKNLFSRYAILFAIAISIALLSLAISLNSIPEYYRIIEDDAWLEDSLSIINIAFAFVTLSLIVVGTTSVELFRRWTLYDKQITELEETTMQSELQQLKNQINPHFLFNMLNNANILMKVDPDEASQMLVKLNDMLQYQLNDSTRNEVFLSADILFLSSFLDLEKIRRDNFEYIVSKEGDIHNIQIPPLLFIPFVENAVKHNPDSNNLSYVHLYFEVQNNELSFICENSKPAIPIKKEQGGLGLSNIKRRLELLYNENYSLSFNETEITYTVNLHLKL
ncbi:sensor histidine kinase [Dysgonomonas sp. ZJ709]|uniref:sensor histidine kinase n=1 Tax=Dysgonomonas sp. ZJ709 TaxID=2709797 RepID=UPI0013EB4557|nr:histidine kinase [Dysgonomonas sp. ZJ709]